MAALMRIDPGDVHTPAQAEAFVLFHQPRPEQHRADADRKVDEKDPVPVDQLRQRASGEQPKRAAAGDHEHEDAHRLGALRGLGEAGDDEGEDDSRGHRAADTLQESRRDQGRGVDSQAIESRGHGEDRHACEEHPLAADQVAGPAGEQEQAAVGDQVAVDDPGEVGLGEVKVALDRGQGDVHDRRVQDDHQLAEADDDEGEPAPAVARRGLGECCDPEIHTAS